VLLTEAKRSDVKLADSFSLNAGFIVTMDRGYTDYALFARRTLAGIFFVTRMKVNAVFRVEGELAVPEHRNIRADQIIRLTGVQAQADCPGPLRRVVVWDADNQREIVLLTNLLDFGSTTIAAIYEERWEIELFFKALKQNVTVKSCVGTSENALRIQLWTALIAMLLLKWLHHLQGELVLVQFGIHGAAESVHLPRVDRLVAQSDGNSRFSRLSSDSLGLELIWTPGRRKKEISF
jgi:IS4 transposase